MSGSYYVDSSNRGNVNELLDQAELYRDQALQYSNAAAASATDADSSEANAQSSATNAASSASAASTSQANAASSASDAASSAANASSFSSSASSFATDAGVARDAAVVAKNDAQTAATNAAASATAATNSATQATNVLSSSLLKANNLSDLVNATTARSNLGLGTAATQTVTTSNTDTTAGRVLKVGDFGLGTTSSSWVTYDLNAIPATGFYFVNGSTSTNLPVVGVFGTLIHIDKGDFGTQLFIQQGIPNSDKTWQRTKISSTWSAWQEVMTSTNVTTSSADSTAGRLLKVGDFGLGSTCVLYSGNLNALRTTGFFRGVNMTNAPSAYWFYVRVMEHGDSGYCTQEATELVSTSPRVYIRNMLEGIWYPWREVSVGVNPKSACTAWVNFNGTGTVAIRDSYNVSSITDYGAGEYKVNFTTPMANANYAVGGSAAEADAAGNEIIMFPISTTFTTSGLKVRTSTGGGSASDSSAVSVIIFGGF